MAQIKSSCTSPAGWVYRHYKPGQNTSEEQLEKAVTSNNKPFLTNGWGSSLLESLQGPGMIKGEMDHTRRAHNKKDCIFFLFHSKVAVPDVFFLPSRKWELVALEDPHEFEVPARSFSKGRKHWVTNHEKRTEPNQGFSIHSKKRPERLNFVFVQYLILTPCLILQWEFLTWPFCKGINTSSKCLCTRKHLFTVFCSVQKEKQCTGCQRHKTFSRWLAQAFTVE